jgi:NADH:ubiquinone reductase (H+-translocating)
MTANIRETIGKRVVIVGAGFAGLKLARKLNGTQFQVVLIDRYNFHQFQPLFYQVATAGLEPSAISFPLRKVFQKSKNVFVRVTDVTFIDTERNQINTRIGNIAYDYLILAHGADTNFFGIQKLQASAYPMKTVGEALALRNSILENFEKAISTENIEERKSLLNIVVVGGGPTGTEISGTLAEMKNTVLPKDYPDLNFDEMKIYLVEAAPKVLNSMSEGAANKAKKYLEKLGVKVLTNIQVQDYDGTTISLSDGSVLKSKTLVWAAGIKAHYIEGLKKEVYGRAGRIFVDEFNRVVGYQNIFALGDATLQYEERYPNGHPQVAQVAIQQAHLLAQNLKRLEKNKTLKSFHYKDLGSMATIGKNLAVVDLPYIKFQGTFAWFFWMFVHLMAIVGIKNRVLVFINWSWSYVTSDPSLRLIIRAKEKMANP